MLIVVAVNITRKQVSIIWRLDSSKRMRSVPEFAPIMLTMAQCQRKCSVYLAHFLAVA